MFKTCPRNDHEHKFHCSICNVNLCYAHGRIDDAKDHVGRDKHKAVKKNQDSALEHFYFNLIFSFYLTLKVLEGQFDPPSGFSKNEFTRERMKPWFSVIFIIIINHIFAENFTENPQDFLLQ